MAFYAKMPPSTSLFYSDFANWKIKVCNFIQYKDPNLYNWFNTIDRYEQPRLDGVIKSRAQMSVKEREEFDMDNRVYEMITMCLPEVVINKFTNQATSTDLWDALIEAYGQKKVGVNEEEDQHTAMVAQIKDVDSTAHEVQTKPVIKCLSCLKLTGDNNRQRDENENLRTNLENLTQANKVLKDNEKLFENKFKAYQAEVQALKAKIFSQQDAIDSYLKEISLLTKELADSQSVVFDLKRHISNFSTSSVVFDYILNREKTKKKGKVGLKYKIVPPPADYSPMPDQDEIKNFVPSNLSEEDTKSVKPPVNEKAKTEKYPSPTFVKPTSKPPVSVEEVVEIEDITEEAEIKVEKVNVKPENHILTNETVKVSNKKGKNKVENESKKVQNQMKDSNVKFKSEQPSTSTCSTSEASTSTSTHKCSRSVNASFSKPPTVYSPPQPFVGSHWHRSNIERRSCFHCGQQGHIIRDCRLVSLDRFGRGMPRTSSLGNSFSKSFSRRSSYSPVSSCASNSPKPMERVNKVVPSKPQVQQHNIVENKSSEPKQVWKPKSTNNTSMKSSEFLKYHKLIDVTVMDDHGQPKSIKAWVSHKY